jgi:cytochrome c peroxidase
MFGGGGTGATACSLLAVISALCAPAVAAADTACDFVESPHCSCAVQAAELAAGMADTGCEPSTAACQIQLPRTFPCPRIPADNPITVEKIELGHLLFYDTRMSDNQTYSCASCHSQDKAFTDGNAVAIGSTGQQHVRSAMSLANVAYAATLTWANPNETSRGSGAAATYGLEHQALTPMFGDNPIIELGLRSEDELTGRLQTDPRYQRMFREAFPAEASPISLDSVLRAVASFERTLLSGNSPYDRSLIDDTAITDSARRGLNLFLTSENENCFHCHNDFNLTTSSDHQDLVVAANITFVNTGLYNVRCSDFGLPQLDLLWCDYPPPPEKCTDQTDANPGLGCHCDGAGPQDMGCYPPPNTGTYSITHQTQDMGRFKPPTLRNIAVTAPYMHDGSIDSLDHVLDHYAAGGRTISEGPDAGVGSDSPTKGQFLRGFTLNDKDRADLLAFLDSLTDQDFLTNPHFADPFRPVACPGDCNLDGTVDVTELVTAINLGLGTSSLALCIDSDPNGDGAVTIDEILRAVHGALNGCT